jgi:hypothetical protein
MSSFQIRFAYNNPEYSDSKVVLTTESLEACRARLAETSAQPSSRQRTPRGIGSSSGAVFSAEEIDVCKLVLCAHSEYFKAAFSWESNSGSDRATRSKRPRDEAVQVVIMSLASEAMFPAAHAMIRFMYLRQLDDGTDRAELIQLFRLADEYGVADLCCACLEQLIEASLEEWTSAELQQLYAVADTVASDSHAEGSLGTAARVMVYSLAARFTMLEEAWRSQEQREIFCSLPYDVVIRVLSCPDVVVKSENTVLIAALSWLRGTQGQQAPLVERTEVLLQVRLLQLSPWFLASLLQPGAIPEALELLEFDEIGKLVRQLASAPAARSEHQAKDQRLQTWATRRTGAVPGMTMDVAAVSMGQQDVIQAVSKCREVCDEGHRVNSLYDSEWTYFDGLYWSTGIQINHVADGVVRVWSGVRASLCIGVEFARMKQGGFLDYPVDCMFTVGDRLIKSPFHSVAACRLGFGHGRALARVGQEDDPEELLDGCFKDGQLTIHATLL